MSLLVGPTRNWRQVFLNFESKNESLFFFERPSFLSSTSSTLSSTRSDAQSAPPELERVFDRICDEYAEWVVRAGKQLPPEWSMSGLVWTVIGDEATHIPGFIKDSYVDVMLYGQNSWLCNEVFQFLDLITS
ncbi:hypothetical protein RYX36_000978 [Vicia faba]